MGCYRLCIWRWVVGSGRPEGWEPLVAVPQGPPLRCRLWAMRDGLGVAWLRGRGPLWQGGALGVGRQATVRMSALMYLGPDVESVGEEWITRAASAEGGEAMLL